MKGFFSPTNPGERSHHIKHLKDMKYLAAKWSKEALLMYSTFCLKTLDFILYKFQVLIVFTLSNKRPKIFLRVILNVKFCSRRIVHFRCFKVICVVLMVLIALVGNILVILSVILNKSMRSVGKRKKIFKKTFQFETGSLISFYRTTVNYYLMNLSIADLMITVWCPVQSLVREFSHEYILPSIFCKIGVFYTGQ